MVSLKRVLHGNEGSACANEMKFDMHHAPGAGAIVDLMTDSPSCYQCDPLVSVQLQDVSRMLLQQDLIYTYEFVLIYLSDI